MVIMMIIYINVVDGGSGDDEEEEKEWSRWVSGPSWRSSVVVWRENTRTHLYPPQTNPLSILENIC